MSQSYLDPKSRQAQQNKTKLAMKKPREELFTPHAPNPPMPALNYGTRGVPAIPLDTLPEVMQSLYVPFPKLKSTIPKNAGRIRELITLGVVDCSQMDVQTMGMAFANLATRIHRRLLVPKAKKRLPNGKNLELIRTDIAYLVYELDPRLAAPLVSLMPFIPPLSDLLYGEDADNDGTTSPFPGMELEDFDVLITDTLHFCETLGKLSKFELFEGRGELILLPEYAKFEWYL